MAISFWPSMELYPGDILHQLVRTVHHFMCRWLYILMMNSVPNFILAFIPAEINGDTLNTMTAFAVRAVHLSTRHNR